ncbi:hypothetical protein MUK70_11950 [Dyadobacter chenwenxiniae]|uniref:Uncharacterized protein n=1 Tax=Dyadobacter chenwenxiniae TaxID=2906456 RepID=A0A9X1PEX2_9BACT|nr:hypothetical protein [Dyadobacter chenwenxiniae]MCF0059955.1 hypothetical protein [Dyadobacter chenwenxiniae]UON85694.1 hypothetical protein MUK70_11950 [Dyadobacter chenwenxiniae]
MDKVASCTKCTKCTVGNYGKCGWKDREMEPGEMILNVSQQAKLMQAIKDAPKIPEGRDVRELPHPIFSETGWMIPVAIVIAVVAVVAGVVLMYLN